MEYVKKKEAAAYEKMAADMPQLDQANNPDQPNISDQSQDEDSDWDPVRDAKSWPVVSEFAKQSVFVSLAANTVNTIGRVELAFNECAGY